MTEEKRNNYKALIWTAGIHILLLAAMLLLRIQLPANQISTEDYIEVDLGTSDDGFGDQQPEYMDGPAPEDVGLAASGSNSNDDIPISASDDPNATPVATSTRRNTINNNGRNSTSNTRGTQTGTSDNAASTPNPRYTYAGGQGNGGNSASRDNPGGSQGDGTGTGDKGVPGGIVGGRYLDAVPDLRGRTLRTRPDPNATFNEGGTVKVRVVVDREGNILRYSYLSVANSRLKQIVEQKIKSVTFTKSATAPPEQSGTITFRFRTSGG